MRTASQVTSVARLTRPPAPGAGADALAPKLARAVARRSEVAVDAVAAGASRRPTAVRMRTAVLQRWPATRVTAHAMSDARVSGGKPAEKRANFIILRNSKAQAARDVIEDLDVNDVWGGLDSDITGTGRNHGVRIDRQNPTPTHANIQIQTNGTSISIATALISDRLAAAKPGALKHHVRRALTASVGDGMQWEVYDDGRPL